MGKQDTLRLALVTQKVKGERNKSLNNSGKKSLGFLMTSLDQHEPKKMKDIKANPPMNYQRFSQIFNNDRRSDMQVSQSGRITSQGNNVINGINHQRQSEVPMNILPTLTILASGALNVENE